MGYGTLDLKDTVQIAQHVIAGMRDGFIADPHREFAGLLFEKHPDEISSEERIASKFILMTYIGNSDEQTRSIWNGILD